MKIIYSGLESSGKSLKLAMVVSDLVRRNAKWRDRTAQSVVNDDAGIHTTPGITRPIYSNIKFTQVFRDWAEGEMGIPLRYWKNLDELIAITDADIICDEVGVYFDSRMWADLSLDVRQWLTQGAKLGIEFYGAAQDFAQVDKSFRRLCNQLYIIRKLIGSRRPSATKPPVKYVWGMCLVQELDPNGYDEDKKKFSSGGLIPSFLFIERRYCEIFDTRQKIERSLPPKMKHIERWCEQPYCKAPGHHKIVHI